MSISEALARAKKNGNLQNARKFRNHVIVRSTVSPYYHYTDTDNRERARAKLTKQNKKKKKNADEVHRGRKKHKKNSKLR